jgi:transforming growth factor-beta-induced protein
MRKLIVLFLLLFMVVPAFAQEDTTTPVQQNMTNVVDIVSDNFVVLTEAVRITDLGATLADGEYTMFAPTDGAFQTMLNDLNLSLSDLLANEPLLEGVLSYHVIPGTISADEIQNGSIDNVTVSGAALSFGYDDAISRVTINNGAASVSQPNIFANNGVVHVIDNVLLPPNVQELLSVEDMTPPSELTMSNLDFINENFLTLSAAIEAAGLTETLASGEYTIFAPTDGAFQTLANDLGISETALLDDEDLLQSILSYHVLPGRITSDAIVNGTIDSTTVNGTALSFGYDEGISRVTIDNGHATIAQPDIYTNDGLVHIIDNVLMPPQ